MDRYIGGISRLTNKNGSVFDLATLYIELNHEEKSVNNLFKVANMINNVLISSKYTFEECRHIILDCFIRNTQINNSYKCSFENILTPGLYYHKELRVQPKPNQVQLDYNTGTLVSQQTEYFVEMVATYTIEDIYKYLMETGLVDETEHPKNRIIGIINFYIKKYGLEMVLFIIDAMKDTLEEYQTFKMETFDNCYQKAKSYYSTIVNNCTTNGGNKICPRQRWK